MWRAPWDLKTGLIATQALPMTLLAFCLGLGIGPLGWYAMWPVSALCVLLGLLGVFWTHAEQGRQRAPDPYRAGHADG